MADETSVAIRGRFVTDVKKIIAASKNNAIRSVNFERVMMYWRLGERIFVEEQRGQNTARTCREIPGFASVVFGQ